jgi:hypothetical protein
LGSVLWQRQERAMILLRWLLSMDQQREEGPSVFTRENTRKKRYRGWSEEEIDKMERLVKEIRLD